MNLYWALGFKHISNQEQQQPIKLIVKASSSRIMFFDSSANVLHPYDKNDNSYPLYEIGTKHQNFIRGNREHILALPSMQISPVPQKICSQIASGLDYKIQFGRGLKT